MVTFDLRGVVRVDRRAGAADPRAPVQLGWHPLLGPHGPVPVGQHDGLHAGLQFGPHAGSHGSMPDCAPKCSASVAVVVTIVGPASMSASASWRTLPTDSQRENTHGQTEPSAAMAILSCPHLPHSWDEVTLVFANTSADLAQPVDAGFRR